MKRLSRQARISLMLSINATFFVAEIAVGYYASSLALVADSFHMLSDMLSLAVALWAMRAVSKTEIDPKYSYGWQRAEILGALFNAAFLIALCVMIVIEGIQRFVSPEPITNPKLVLITACAGLGGNIIGLLLFREHGHSHGHGHGHHHDQDELCHEKGEHHPKQGHLNMKGIFLHVMGDALGNFGVIATALFVWLTDFSWRFYMDALVSLVIAILLFLAAIPLVRETSNILLQASSIAIDDVRDDISQLKEVVSIHELHIWQLSDTKHIASLHVLLKSPSDYMTVASDMRKLLHRRGIHSATIQPEFLNGSNFSSSTSLISSRDTYTEEADMLSYKASESACLLRCEEQSCVENACCPLVDSRK